MRPGLKRFVAAVSVVVVSSVATAQAAHAASSAKPAPKTAVAAVALRGTPVSTTDSSGTASSKAFSTPSAAVAGDLLVASLSYKTPTAADIANTAPSGWTKIPGELFDVSTTSGSHLVLAVKVAAGGTESASWTFASAPAGMVISVLAYSGAETTIDPGNGVYPFEKYGYKIESGGSSTTTHTAPAFTPSVPGSWGFAAFAARASETWTPGAGLTERSDVRAASSNQATLETDDSNGTIATGSPITYSATEPSGTSVEVSFGGNIKPSGGQPQPVPPTVTTGGASGITNSAAIVAGTINPNGLSTTYHFDYGTTTSYGSQAPASDGSAGSGSANTPVSASLSGLTALTTYHYRLVATNSAGTTNGSDATFTTAVGDIGYPGPSTAGAGAAATGEKPESKLWWNDGFWWGSLFDTVSQTYRIFRLDRSTETWINTGTQIDNRARSDSDTLWDGTHLYVATHVKASSSSDATPGNPARLYRYSYNSTTQAYSLDTGFPAQIDNYSSETLTIAKDSTGALWASWAQGSMVYVNSTTGSDASWGTPFALSVTGSTTLEPDDISAIVAFGGTKIGIMWSNQVNSAMYFAIHDDGTDRASWEASRTALQGPSSADDHINLKTLDADTSGRVYAAVKTSLDDAGAAQSAPQIMLLVRDPATGDWASYPVWRIQDCPTRPIVMLDSEHQMIYIFATAPNSGCPFSGSDGTIFMKSTPMNSISFSLGRGTPVISDSASPHLNNVTSTKQSVNSTTGLVVLTSNDITERYWHADITLGAL
jgi:hypothetical protein